MSKKFIPNGDGDFLQMAENFADAVTRDGGRWGIGPEDVTALNDAVNAYRDKYFPCKQAYTRTPALTAAKEAARRGAEHVIRRLAAGLRIHPAVDAADRSRLHLPLPAAKAKPAGVADERVVLEFERAIHVGTSTPEHVVSFRTPDFKARPAGAVRLELFVELIPPDVHVQQYYQNGGPSRPVYVRSYLKSPITLVPPLATVPMRVVYRGRWADGSGAVGPMSDPAPAWVEGGSMHLGETHYIGQQPRMRVDVSTETVERETTVLVALVHGQAMKAAERGRLQGTVVRQIEGPGEAA